MGRMERTEFKIIKRLQTETARQLPLAMGAWLSLPLIWPSLSDKLLNSSPVWPPHLPTTLQPLAARLSRERASLQDPEQAENLRQAIADEAIARAQRFVTGLRTYHQSPVRRDAPEAPVIWQSGTTKLRDYNPAGGTVILVIPSLINRFDILDLDADHSLLRLMASVGLRPLVVDWDAPGDDERDFRVADYVMQRLLPIVDFVTSQDAPASRRGDVHILGYCMGGLLALALAALWPEKARSLALMATPWDFGDGDVFCEVADKVEPFLRELGCLPVSVIQHLFAAFQPMHAARKFTRFATFDPASPEARRFVLTEDWLNDGVPLTAPVARTCLREWYGENRTATLRWKIDGQVIDPQKLNIPSYVLVPGRDKIVPPDSALPLARLLHGATLHEPMMGHIGLLASSRAPREVWLPLIKWMAEH